MEEGVEDIAFWPDEAADLGEGAFVGVESGDAGWLRFGEDEVFHFFEVVAEGFEDGEAVIDDGVEEGVAEVIGAEFTDGAAAGADAIADGVKDIGVGFFLDGDEEIG